MHQIRHIAELTVVPSEDLYLTVRAAFIAQGTTLNAWCIANGVNRQTAAKALKGQRHGKLSRALRDRLIEAAFQRGAAA